MRAPHGKERHRQPSEIASPIGHAASLSCLLALALAMFCVASASECRAQSETAAAGTGASYVTPFPAGDVYQMQVWGDGNAQDLADSLAETFGKSDPVTVSRKARVMGSLLRSELPTICAPKSSPKRPLPLA